MWIIFFLAFCTHLLIKYILMQRTCITKFVDLINISECAKPLLYMYPCTVLCIIPTSKKKRQQHFPGVWVHCVQQKIRENVTGISQSQCTGSTTGRSARRCSALCGTQFCSRLSHGCCGISTSCRVLSLKLFWPSFRYLWPSIRSTIHNQYFLSCVFTLY